MTPEEVQKQVRQEQEDNEMQRISAITRLYSQTIESFSKDPRRFLPEFDLEHLDNQKCAEDFGLAMAHGLLGMVIGLITGVEPFIKEEGARRYVKRRQSSIAEHKPKGVKFPQELKSEEELYAQTEPCNCGHTYSEHTNKDTGPCSAFRCDCIHFDKKGE